MPKVKQLNLEVKRIPVLEEPDLTVLSDLEEIRKTATHLTEKQLIAIEKRKLGERQYEQNLIKRMRGLL